jgi:hypothetical protein
MFGISEISFSALTGHPFLTTLFFILFILFSIYLYRRTNPPLPRGVRIILTTLRLIAVLALFAALYEPIVSYKRDYKRKPRLSILMDRSGSMQKVEAGMTRSERIDSIMADRQFQEFADKFDTAEFGFAGGLIDPEAGADSNTQLNKTAIGDAILALAERELEEPAEFWLLISDGISNDGISPAIAAEKARTPIFCVGVGLNIPEKDVAISGIENNSVVFAGKPTELTVRLEWAGMTNDTAEINVRSGEKKLQTKKIVLAPGKLKSEEKMTFVPERPGRQTFQASVENIGGEASYDNNRRSFSMTVLKSKLKVLMASDRLDWEYAFLNRLLNASPSVELAQVVSRKEGGYIDLGFPARQEELNAYDLIILYDVDLDRLKSKAELIKSFLIDKGGGLLVFMGENYIKETFPRWIDDYLPFIVRNKKAKIYHGAFNGAPEENYLFHPAVRLSDSRKKIYDSWKNMPPFETIVPIDSIASNAELLAMSGLNLAGMDIPVMGSRNYGAGKVLAFSSSPFWKWFFYDYGFGGAGEAYRALFEGAVNWMALREESDPIKIYPDKIIYTRGEKVGFSASVFDLGFRPIKGAAGNIFLINKASQDTIAAHFLEKSEAQYRAELDAIPPGNYSYSAVIEKDGKKLKESGGEITVEDFSIEEFQLNPDFGVLESISQKTGGRFYAWNEINGLYVALSGDKISVSAQREIALWGRFWLLTLFVLALGAEWFIRKKYQLI